MSVKKPRSCLSRTMRTALACALFVPLHLTTSTPVDAACLGLSLPAPKQLNVCERLLESVWNPAVMSCGGGRWWMKWCDIPYSCLAFPECLTVEVAGYWQYAGDIECSLKNMTAGSFIEDAMSGVIEEPEQLLGTGTLTPMYLFGGYHVDSLECAADPLNYQLKVVLEYLAAQPGIHENVYQSVDIEEVSILPGSYGTAGWYLRDGYAGITLGSLVILDDEYQAELANWSYTLNDVLWGRLSDSATAALSVIVHELIHVRQYREAGRERFLNEYLFDTLFHGGYSHMVGFEFYAYNIEEQIMTELRREQDRWMAVLMSTLPL